MALPTGPYQGQDLTQYQAGNKFLPRQFYSLDFPNTPPPSVANTPTGITNTQAAGSYMGYPSYEAWLLAQGGGGGGGGRDDPNPVNRYDPNQNLGTTNITDYEADAADVGSTWAGSWAKAKDDFSNLPLPMNLLRRGVMIRDLFDVDQLVTKINKALPFYSEFDFSVDEVLKQTLKMLN